MKAKTALIALLMAGFLFPALAEEPVLDNDEKKTFYALGYAISGSVKVFDLSEAELALVIAGLSDGVAGKDARVDINQFQAQLQALAKTRSSAGAAKEKAAGAEFLTKTAKEAGAKVLDSGLIMFTMTEGTGPYPKATDKVKVHYHGMLTDGTVFDSSVDRGEPTSFPLNRVIPCWTEGVQLIKVGGKSKLVCPSDIAYGDNGAPPKIPPGATLIFEVELLAIE